MHAAVANAPPAFPPPSLQPRVAATLPTPQPRRTLMYMRTAFSRSPTRTYAVTMRAAKSCTHGGAEASKHARVGSGRAASAQAGTGRPGGRGAPG